MSAAPAKNGEAPIAALIMTYNEERNLPRCLDSIKGWAAEIHVIDSFSTDATVEIAREYGATVHQHTYENHTAQWSWALENLELEHDWILALDSDFIVTPELRETISRAIPETPDEVSGYYVRRRQMFRGRWIKHGTMYPRWWLRLFRRDRVTIDPNNIVDLFFYVKGESRKLKADVIEDNFNDHEILFWMSKQGRFAERQAREHLTEMRSLVQRPDEIRFFGTPNQRRLWLKRMLLGFPLYTRPFVYFIYRYFLRLGFLDGKEGFLFHMTQAFVYRLMVDVRIEELRSAADEDRPAGDGT